MTDLGNIGRTGIDTWAKRGTLLHCAVFAAHRKQPLSTETFRLVSFSGQESVSQPFQFQLELHANSDLKGDDPVRFSDMAHEAFQFSDLIGRPVTVGIDEPITDAERDGRDFWAQAIAGGEAEHLSVFNGIVTAFSMGAPGVYHLTMQPALWRLTLTNAYRVHHGKNIVDAIGDLLRAHNVEHSLAAVSGTDNPAVTRVQDWLQAGESDFDFIQRLMSEADIYFYFEHTATSHKVVFANRPNYPDAYEDGRLLRYTHTSAEPLGQEQDDVITDYRYSQSLVSSGVRGSLVRQEAAWEKDSVAKVQAYGATSAADLGELPFHRYQVCQYGGCDDEAAWETSRVNESLATSATELSGSSHCVRFRCGHQFRLAKAEFNGRGIRTPLTDSAFVLTQVQHQAEVGGSYSNQFKATEADGLITPFSLHDTQQGVVLAQVVAHENGTAPKDWRYYQKDNFDPEQESIDQSHCGGDHKHHEKHEAWHKPKHKAPGEHLRAKGVYVRFVTDPQGAEPVWIKLAPHMQTVPEIGVIVQVSRANDLTELPEIQSIVQNNGNRVVTPSGWTANTNVGSNYSTSYGDSKSVRFGLSSVADLDGAVNRITPKYHTGKFRDVSYSQGGSYSYSTAEGGRSGMLSESESCGSTYSRHQGDVSRSCSDIGYSYSQQKIGSTDSHTTIDGKSYSESTIGESESYSTITGNQYSENHVQGHSASLTTLVTSSSDSTAVLQASSSLTGVEQRDGIVGLSVSQSATGVSLSQSVTGASVSESALGASVSVNAVGASISASLTGFSSSDSQTGSSNSQSLTASSTSLSGSGNVSDISAIVNLTKVSNVGVSTVVEIEGGKVKSSNAPAELEAELKSTSVSLMSAVKLIM